MNVRIKNYNPEKYGIHKFQEGGNVAAPEAAAPQGGEDPMAMLLQGAQQAVETQDCNVAIQVCQMLLELAGGGGQEAAPVPETQPVYKKGGRLVKRIPKD